MKTHVFIGCSASKRSHACRAADLYTGELFRLSLRWARLYGGEVWILSALYGVIPPEDVIEPYEATLADAESRRAWTDDAATALLQITEEDDRIVALAGAAYCGWRDALVDECRSVSLPLEHLGIGHRKQRLAEEIALMEHPWWDRRLAQLNDNLLASLRVLWDMRAAVEAAHPSGREKLERDLAQAIKSHQRQREAYAEISRPEPKAAADVPQLSLFARSSAADQPIRGGASVDTARSPVSAGRPVDVVGDAATSSSAPAADRCTEDRGAA